MNIYMLPVSLNKLSTTLLQRTIYSVPPHRSLLADIACVFAQVIKLR